MPSSRFSPSSTRWLVLALVCVGVVSVSAQPDFAPSGNKPVILEPELKGAKLQADSAAASAATADPPSAAEILKTVNRGTVENYLRIIHNIRPKLDTKCGPWECFMNGNCLNGRCQCFIGFSGKFCQTQDPLYNSTQRTFSLTYVKDRFGTPRAPIKLEDIERLDDQDTRDVYNAVLTHNPLDPLDHTKPKRTNTTTTKKPNQTTKSATKKATKLVKKTTKKLTKKELRKEMKKLKKKELRKEMKKLKKEMKELKKAEAKKQSKPKAPPKSTATKAPATKPASTKAATKKSSTKPASTKAATKKTASVTKPTATKPAAPSKAKASIRDVFSNFGLSDSPNDDESGDPLNANVPLASNDSDDDAGISNEAGASSVEDALNSSQLGGLSESVAGDSLDDSLRSKLRFL